MATLDRATNYLKTTLLLLFLCLTSSMVTGFFVGVAVSPAQVQNPSLPVDKIVRTYFQDITGENAMKWGSLEKVRGQYDFHEADMLVSYAKSNSLELKFHCILWHRQYPQYLDGLGKEELMQATQMHIDTVIKRYGPAVKYIDVCNEVFGDQGGKLRENIWYKTIGESYIVDVFTAAKEATQKYKSNAKLCINEYSVEGINEKSNALFKLAGVLKQRHLLDCVGLQAHLIVGQVPKDMKQNMERFANLGLDVTLSELDIRMKVNTGPQELEQNKQQQAHDFLEVFQNCQSVRGCVGVTVWGVSDSTTWVTQEFPGMGYPLLFDENNRPKPVLQSLSPFFKGPKSGIRRTRHTKRS